jgi:hypothetical protein
MDALRVEIDEASAVRSRTCYLAFGAGDGNRRSLESGGRTRRTALLADT